MVSGKNISNIADKTDLTNYKGKLYGENQFTEEARLDWEPLTFQSYGKIARTTNKELATTIKEYLAKTFHDIRGVNIAYVPGMGRPGSEFRVELFFSNNFMPIPTDKDKKETKIKNVFDLSNPFGDENTIFYKKKALENRIRGNIYTINDETKLLLSDFCYGGKKANLPNNNKWTRYIEELRVPTSDPTFNTRASECIVKVSGCFDIHRFLKRIYGNRMVIRTDITRDDDNNLKAHNTTGPAEYEIRFIKYVANEPNVFIVNIEQFDKAQVQEYVLKENPFQKTGLSGIYYF